MLQVTYIRENKKEVLKRLAKKHFDNIEVVEEVLRLDEVRRKLLGEKESRQAEINKESARIGEMMKSGRKDKANEAKEAVKRIKDEISQLSDSLNNTEIDLHDALVKIPNLPHASVPEGNGAEDNEVVKKGGEIPELGDHKLPHWELAKKYNLIDFELGNKVTGSGFPFYVGQGARLQRALIHYFLDYNTAAGYTEYQAPLMVNEESAYSTGQLPDKEGQMYYIGQDNYYLIPTAEVPLTNILRKEIIEKDQLPVKLTGYTPCFRREAGSYGKDVRGLNRLHQFDKVEIVQVVNPAGSYDVLDDMVAHVEGLVQSLGLPYRILRLCGGDLSFTSALTYDFEVFSAAQEKWLEVSSVSNFESYQANRAKIRYRDEQGKPQLAHTLNGSSLALPRIVAALIENNQSENGVHIPEVLQKYFGAEWIGEK